MSGGLMSGGLKSYDHRLSVAVLLLPLFVSHRFGAWRQGGCVCALGRLASGLG